MRVHILLFMVLITPSIFFGQAARTAQPRQKLTIGTGFTGQVNGITQISTFNTNGSFYASDFKNYSIGTNNANAGFHFDMSYEIMFKRSFFLRMATGIESVGYITWVNDFGGGLRHYFNRTVGLSFEAYFTVQYSAIKLGIVGVNQGNNRYPQSVDLHLGRFGFKGRVALEFLLAKSLTLSPYISYAAYPWSEHKITDQIPTDLIFNGVQKRLLYDVFQIGIQLGYTY